MFRESEFELAARQLEYQLSSVSRPTVRIVEVQGSREFEFEVEGFDPRPPPRGTIVVSGFAPNGSRLNATQRAILDRVARNVVAEMPRQHPVMTVIIDAEGHEDETGDPGQFRRLGVERSRAAARHLQTRLLALMSRMPAANKRLVIIQVQTAGPNRPIRSNVTAAGRAQNRRVEIRVRFENRTI